MGRDINERSFEAKTDFDGEHLPNKPRYAGDFMRCFPAEAQGKIGNMFYGVCRQRNRDENTKDEYRYTVTCDDPQEVVNRVLVLSDWRWPNYAPYREIIKNNMDMAVEYAEYVIWRTGLPTEEQEDIKYTIQTNVLYGRGVRVPSYYRVTPWLTKDIQDLYGDSAWCGNLGGRYVAEIGLIARYRAWFSYADKSIGPIEDQEVSGCVFADEYGNVYLYEQNNPRDNNSPMASLSIGEIVKLSFAVKRHCYVVCPWDKDSRLKMTQINYPRNSTKEAQVVPESNNAKWNVRRHLIGNSTGEWEEYVLL